jgi:hypothetical protein
MRLFSLLAVASLIACNVAMPGSPHLPGADTGNTDAGPGHQDAGPGGQDAVTAHTCDDDRFEPNDTMQNSRSAANASGRDLIACGGNEDWFLLELDEAERAKLQLTHDGSGDINMQVLSESGEFLASVDRRDRTMYTDWLNGPVQIYILITNPARASSQYMIEVFKERIECEKDRFEDNNSADAAERIAGGQHGDLTFCGDDDYYRFTAASGSMVTAQVLGVEGLTLELLDESGERSLRTASPSDQGLSLSYQAEDQSVFFLRVTGDEELTGEYTLVIDREVDGNNTCEQAETIGLARNAEVTVEGSTRDMDNNFAPSCGAREDGRNSAPDSVYAVVVPEGGGTLIVSMAAQTDRFDTVLALRSACDDEDSELICNDDHGGGEGLERTDSRIEEEVEAGTYYLLADGFVSSSGNYELSFFLRWEEPETGPACETAQAIEVQERGRVVLPVNNQNALRQYEPRTCAGRSGDQGRELAFSFRVEQASRLNALTAASDNGRSYDTVLYLLRGCGGMDEIACHDDISNDNKLSRLSDVELAPGTYTLVADAFYERDVGAVNLTIELSAP